MDIKIYSTSSLLRDSDDPWSQCIMSRSRYFLVFSQNDNTLCCFYLFWHSSLFAALQRKWNILRSYPLAKTYEGRALFSKLYFLYLDFW